MENPDYLENMSAFKGALEPATRLVSSEDKAFEPVIADWVQNIKTQFTKGLVPLFVTGSGMSGDVPNMNGILEKLETLYVNKSSQSGQTQDEDIDNLFKTYRKHSSDRSVVGRILNTFQGEKNSSLYSVWQELNNWLLNEIVEATPSDSHEILASLMEEVDAKCVTLNFDGLLVRQMIKNEKIAFSLPMAKDCERFFLRTGGRRGDEFLEIGARGDILYLICQRSQEEGFCPEKGKEQSIWAFLPATRSGAKILLETMRKCPACGDDRVSYLSFPGSDEKERDIQEILAVLWQYLCFRVSCVTVLGVSGWWDPVIVAFLGDLLAERNIPLLLIDKKPKDTFLYKELIQPGVTHAIALECECDIFSNRLKRCFENQSAPSRKSNPRPLNEGSSIQTAKPFCDPFWDILIIKRSGLLQSFTTAIERELEKRICDDYQLDKCAQLGLKSKWLGIPKTDGTHQNGYHNRLQHSLGVMTIASYLYDKITKQSPCDTYNENEKQFLRIAALLHDVGHLPFAHLIEEIFDELKWKPAGYETSFTHTLNTTSNITKMFQQYSHFEEEISKLGYSKDDLVKLINGEMGVHYLDAIINSPIDADKIDYIFRDTTSTAKSITLSPVQFLKDIVKGASFTPEGFLSLSGVSARASADLLETRAFLYKHLYLRPGIRFLECAIKFIAITYFVHWVGLQDGGTAKISEEIAKAKKPFSDLGDYKIRTCIERLQAMAKEGGQRDDDEVEMFVVRKMKEYLLGDSINGLRAECFLTDKVKKAIGFCFERIEGTNGEDDLKKLEATIIYHSSRGMSAMEILQYRKAARDCVLRLPGAILIDIKEPSKFLSVADARKAHERSDGTRAYSECIIVPGGDYSTWRPSQTADTSTSLLSSCLAEMGEKTTHVYIYRMTKSNSDVDHAVNLFEKLLRQKGIGEVE